MATNDNIKFVADHMLGRLARWLRILGYDTLYPEPGPDRELIELAKLESRILLTRDKTVAETKKAETLYIESDLLDEQLAQLALEFKLKFDANIIEEDDGSLVNRCGICNGILRPIPADIVKKHVPEGVQQHVEKFWKCSGCEKIYWEGTHWEQIGERIKEIQNNLEKTKEERGKTTD